MDCHLCRYHAFLVGCLVFGGSGAIFLNFSSIKSFLFRNLLLNLPFIKKRIRAERIKNKDQFEKDVLRSNKSVRYFTSLPKNPVSEQEVLGLLAEHMKLNDQNAAYLSGCIYRKSEYLDRIAMESFRMFIDSNPLHSDVFKGTRKMEAEVVRMVAEMFHGGHECAGSITSGGTESLVLAVKTYRDRFIKSNGTIKCNVILASTAHPAILKACKYFAVEARIVDVDSKSKKIKVSNVQRIIDGCTCAIFLSAPCYPYGVMDPILEISRHCAIPIHVDACLGSFLVPFLDHLDCFDFRIERVTSISCDTHKYGLCPKGSSVLVYRNSDLFSDQIFAYANWPGGIYATSTIAGSRAGMLSCAAYATLLAVGEFGYREQASSIFQLVKQIARKIEKIDGLRLIVEPEVCVVSCTTNSPINVLDIVDLMKCKGWHLVILQDPPGFHIALTQNHLSDPKFTERFIGDLQDVTERLKSSEKVSDPSQLSVLYGTNQKLPDRKIIEDTVVDYFVALTRTPQ